MEISETKGNENEEIHPSIDYLPNEIILLILQYNNRRDIISFGCTCKRFCEMVMNSQILWKNKFKQMVPINIFNAIDKYGNGNWLQEIKEYVTVKRVFYKEICKMSSLFYWRADDIKFQDIRVLLLMAVTKNQTYSFAIHILQNLIRKTNKYLSNYRSFTPYTLTEMHYAKVVLRHLIHAYLAVKWVIALSNDELPPEIVVNFFSQWVDTSHMYSDATVETIIGGLVEKVETILERQSASRNIKEKFTQRPVKQEDILAAITQVIYRQYHMAVTTTANLQTLSIEKALEMKCGNVIVVAAIYHAVARRCGVRCELMAFPNHLFLEWRENWNDPQSQAYTINLKNGELKPKGRCPFSGNPNNQRFKYDPASLLQSLYSAFHLSMGYIKDWNTQNAYHLLDFLGTSNNNTNPYRRHFTCLFENLTEGALNTPLRFECLSHVHMQMLMTLFRLDCDSAPIHKKIEIRHHDSKVLYAVGMICCHTKLNYVCVVRAWDLRCRDEWIDRMEIELQLKGGMNQPFYYVLAVDQSTRYVAQENLKDVRQPCRLYHLEDIIAREFTHFDGFCYVPNEQKRLEYPGEEPVAGMYRNRAFLLY